MDLPSIAIPYRIVFPIQIIVIKPIIVLFVHSDMQSRSKEPLKHALLVIHHQVVADVIQLQQVFVQHAHMEVIYQMVSVKLALLDALIVSMLMHA